MFGVEHSLTIVADLCARSEELFFNLLVLKCVAIASCSGTPSAKGGRQLHHPRAFVFFAGHFYALRMKLNCALFRCADAPIPPVPLDGLSAV